MSELDEMIFEIERQEDEQDMHYSLYSIPEYYLEEGEII